MPLTDFIRENPLETAAFAGIFLTGVGTSMTIGSVRDADQCIDTSVALTQASPTHAKWIARGMEQATTDVHAGFGEFYPVSAYPGANQANQPLVTLSPDASPQETQAAILNTAGNYSQMSKQYENMAVAGTTIALVGLTCVVAYAVRELGRGLRNLRSRMTPSYAPR